MTEITASNTSADGTTARTRVWIRAAWAIFVALSVTLFAVSNATAQSAEDDPAQVEAGKAVYEMGCAGCHGEAGEGTDRGRPLVGIAAEQPDRSVHIASVTDGKGAMPALGERLEAEQIDAVVSFVRLSFVAESAETTALADTGVESRPLAVVGTALVVGGALLVTTSRRMKN